MKRITLILITLLMCFGQVVPCFAVTKHENAASSFFDNTVFVGDSITEGFRLYVSYERIKGRDVLGKAQFLAVKNYGLSLALKNSQGVEGNYLKYKGQRTRLFDGLHLTGAERVFILLGINDKIMMNKETNIKRYAELIDRFKKELPYGEVFVQSLTPIGAGTQEGRYSNAYIDEFNKELREVCIEKSVHFVDINTPLKRKDGHLELDYSSDRSVHLNAAGFDVWLKTLYDFVSIYDEQRAIHMAKYPYSK